MSPARRVWSWVKPRWRGWVPYLLLAGMMLYTADQLFTSERGLMTWRVMRQQIAVLEADVARLHEDITRLNRNLDRLRGPLLADGSRAAPDTDFIDELLRENLGVVREGEVVILKETIPPVPRAAPRADTTRDLPPFDAQDLTDVPLSALPQAMAVEAAPAASAAED